jgi:diguanylate cyclase (GGDEF)-like protein/PAS domain S-box-containing protein
MDELISMKRKAADRELAEKLQYYSDIAENTPVGIITCDENGNIKYVNSMVVKLLGSPSIEETKKINLFTFPLLIDCGFSDKLKQSIQTDTHINYELNYESKWGRRIWLNIHNKPFLSGGARQVIIILDDLTERKNIESQLTSLSFTDALTGAYNRRYFVQRAQEEIDQAKRLNRRFSIIMFDLDHFKDVNDNYGHEAGDRLLCEIGNRIRSSIKEGDVAARIGGDEFITLIYGINGRSDAAKAAEKILISMGKPIELSGKSFNISSSIGLSIFPDDGEEAGVLIKKADKAMYMVKKEKNT